MRSFISLIIIASAALSFAGETTKKELTPEQKAKARESMMRQTGGFIDQRGKGRIAVINCQAKIADAVIKERADHFFKSTRFMLDITKGSSFSYDTAKAMRVKDGSSSALFIIDDPSLPMSMLSIEERWGMINIAKLFADSESDETKEKRFKKEFVRIAGLTFGGSMPIHTGTTFTPIVDGASLEKYPMNGYGINCVQSITQYQKSHGVTQGKHTVYLVACQEGWAPAPTNEYQRAIWDKVHSIPQKPMKIQFDSAAQKGKVTK